MIHFDSISAKCDFHCEKMSIIHREAAQKKEKLQNLICNTYVLKFLSDSGLYSWGYAANI